MNPTPVPYDNGATFDPGALFAGFAAAGIIGFLIALLIAAAWVALIIWVAYTIIWRAVRRGLYEYHNPRPSKAARDLGQRVQGPRDW